MNYDHILCTDVRPGDLVMYCHPGQHSSKVVAFNFIVSVKALDDTVLVTYINYFGCKPGLNISIFSDKSWWAGILIRR